MSFLYDDKEEHVQAILDSEIRFGKGYHQCSYYTIMLHVQACYHSVLIQTQKWLEL